MSYDYDENGNQIERGSDTFEWDHENRLTATEIDSVSGSYMYNGDGLRASRTLAATTISYVWDVGSGLPSILQDSDENTYVYGLDLISRTDDQGDQEYNLYDGIGSTTGLTDEQGDVTDEYEYDVFGATRSQTGSSPNEFKFTGEQVDSTGMEYLRARYYDQATGRFLSQDPLPLLQQYPYVMNNPVNLVDPYGLFPCPGCGAVVDRLGDAGECVWNRGDCVDPRGLVDPLIELIPEGRLPYVPFDIHVSYQLLATCALYPVACAAGAEAAVEALAMTALFYPGINPLDRPEGIEGRPKEDDAFTHCYWSGLVTLRVGAGKAEKITSRFEAYGSENEDDQRAYDMENNRLGRNFAQGVRYTPGATLSLLAYCRLGPGTN